MYKSNVISYFGNLTSVATFLGISQPAVSRWGSVIPEKQALRLERKTDGKLKYESRLYKQAC